MNGTGGLAAAANATCREPPAPRPFNAGTADTSDFPWRTWQRLQARAARELGHEGIAQTCEQIIREEEEMARWVGQQIPVITTMELQEAARG